MAKYLWILMGLLMACKAQKPTTPEPNTSSNSSPVQTVTSIPSSAQPLAFEVIKEGQYCGYNDAGNFLITDAESWEALWTKVGSNQIPPPDLPEVDFSRHVVIASFMGPQNSGGHSIKIRQIQAESSTAYISVVQQKPGENCFVTDAITQPFSIIRIEKGEIGSAAFLTKEETNEC